MLSTGLHFASESTTTYRGRFARGVERDPLHGPFGRGMVDAAE